MPKVVKSSSSRNIARPTALSGPIAISKKSNEGIIKARLQHLRRVASLTFDPTEPPALRGQAIINEGMYLGTGSKGIRSLDDRRFKNLGRWFWRTADKGQTQGETLFEVGRIPLASLLGDLELTEAIERRGVAVRCRFSSSASQPCEVATPTASEPPLRPSHLLSSLPPSSPPASLRSIPFGIETHDTDDEIEFLGCHLSSDGPVADDNCVPDSDLTFVDDTDAGVAISDKGKQAKDVGENRIEATETEIEFKVVIFGWASDNDHPARVAVPVLRADAGFLSLQGIKYHLGSIGFEMGDQVERYVLGDRAWRPLKWSTPFPISKNMAVALRLTAVTRMNDWDDYRDHIFSL
ncbi:hypothetical protein PQX77_002491 [Marasmius sp. AFHP31]|nr:hypothetical protein PQX77_002491 [Marasmius sp. AFHP31]